MTIQQGYIQNRQTNRIGKREFPLTSNDVLLPTPQIIRYAVGIFKVKTETLKVKTKYPKVKTE